MPDSVSKAKLNRFRNKRGTDRDVIKYKIEMPVIK